jgi:hypothetical protein
MTHNTVLRLSCLMAALIWLACSSLQTAGVITETTNGAIVSGMVAAPDGTPYSGVRVDLRSVESCSACSTSAVISTVTDEKGCYAFDSLQPGTYVVFSAPTLNQALAKTVVVSSEVHALTVPDSRVKPTASVSGVVSAVDGVYPITIAVMGTNIKTATDLSGWYTFDFLPQAEFIYRFSRNNPLSPAIVVPAALVASSDTFKLDTAIRVFIENFDKGAQTNLLYPFLGAGSWYIIAEDSVTVTPASAITDVSAALSAVNAWKGRSLSLEVTSTASAKRSIIIVLGLNIGKGLGWADDSQRWFDFSKLTALSFMARGTGTLHVAFLTELIFKHYTGASHFEKIITLSPAWQEYRILAGDIAPPEGSEAEFGNVTWIKANTRVAEITFFTDDSLNIGLDDIAIEGVSLLDLISSGR